MPRPEHKGRSHTSASANDAAAGPKWKGKTHKAKEGTLNGMKKRARTIDRQFKRGVDMPATVRNDLERELRSLKTSIAAIENKRNRSQMIKKYHMVRFFERQKATRKLKQARKALEESPDDETIKQDVYMYEVDLDYTYYYPFLERYISLYASKGEEESNSVPQGHVPVPGLNGVQRPPIWSVIVEARKLGNAALERLRDRMSIDVDPLKEPSQKTTEEENKKPKKTKKESSKNNREAAAPDNDSDDDSDGGFFE
ncbi:hypothetical protein BROUX41_001485 [Berkeleyomyces rouxiae]|uniref:uncharacterized protein n=1 Tax=Berkeleyomyces rouxiae TaxID=2035830 RepID=UPI003B79B6C2